MTTPTTADRHLLTVARLLRKLDICILTTRAEGGGLHGRPMSNNGEVEYDGDSWFFAQDGGRMVREIDADGCVGLGFVDTPNGTWLNVEGEATVVRDDDERKRQLWQKDLSRWFQDGPEDPKVVLIKVAARHIDAWAEEEYHFDVAR